MLTIEKNGIKTAISNDAWSGYVLEVLGLNAIDFYTVEKAGYTIRKRVLNLHKSKQAKGDYYFKMNKSSYWLDCLFDNEERGADKVETTTLEEWGYTWDGMKEVTKQEAMHLFNTNKQAVYLLYSDGHESMIEESERFNETGVRYGVEKED